ncbi:hypothetical protein [Novosphingobium soli]|uniref:DUF3072 domain-containing protein n=1 Tax=Novosphingobium soli TaxID=574956 RepID=A0ABV6CS92_9SPHN
MIERPDDLAHETDQDMEEEESQAQTVTDEARLRNTAAQGLSDSEKPSNPLDPADTPDVVDHINQMERDGRVDMSAFDGEETMDDLENRYGSRHAADEQFSEDDS